MENTTNPYLLGKILLFDKPYRWTSFDVAKKVKFLLKKRFQLKDIKVGHAGTLDPLATGLIIVCTGKATKLIDGIQSQAKEYIANIKLGETTPSYDLETEVDKTFPHEHITAEMITQTLQKFIGEQEQTPPIFSAKKIDGKRAYTYARNGEEVVMKKAIVNMYDLEWVINEKKLPWIDVRIACSKGTYIRSFAYDFGLALQSGAHLTGLRRTKIGDYKVENAIDPDSFGDLLLKEPEF